MKKLILILLILLTLSACHQKIDPLNTLEIKDIYSKSDGFVYRDFKWGMSLAEVEKLSGLESYVPELLTNREGVGAWAQAGGQKPTIRYFTQIENVTMFGRAEEKWSVTFTYDDDELIWVDFSINYPEEKAGELWDFYYETLEKLKQELGVPDEAIESGSPESTMTSARATWIHVVDGEENNRINFMINSYPAGGAPTTSLSVVLNRLPLPELTN